MYQQMAFSSMGAEIKSPPKNGPYCFRILDEIDHLISSLYPNERHTPEYGQFNIFDYGEATRKRPENQQTEGIWPN
jgi:hypothetical protein